MPIDKSNQNFNQNSYTFDPDNPHNVPLEQKAESDNAISAFNSAKTREAYESFRGVAPTKQPEAKPVQEVFPVDLP
ncbi:MAG: hypothetical protein ACYC4E_00390 [Carboxydocellales bacterium]